MRGYLARGLFVAARQPQEVQRSGKEASHLGLIDQQLVHETR